MTLSKREKTLLLILGIVLFVYLYFILFLSPVFKRIQNSRDNINNYKNAIENFEVKNKELSKKTKELEEIKTKFDIAKTVLPMNEKNPEIIYNIKKFFEGNRVEVTNVTLGEPDVYSAVEANNDSNSQNQNNQQNNSQNNNTNLNAQMMCVPVTISISANNYADIVKSIKLFENDKRFVEITSISINSYRAEIQKPKENVVVPKLPASTKVRPDYKPSEDSKIDITVIEEDKDNGNGLNDENDSGQAKIEKSDNIEKNLGNDLPVSQPIIAPEIQENRTEKPKAPFQVVIVASYYYINTQESEGVNYNFNSVTSGKSDIFKR